jgi:hypothetical protein
VGERAALGERATLDAWLQASDGSSTARPEVIEVWFVPGMHWQEEGEVYWPSGDGFVASRTLESSDGFVASHTTESSGEGFVAIGKGSAAVVADQEQPVRCGPGLATGAGWAEAEGGSKWEAKPRRRWRSLFARVFLVVVRVFQRRRADPEWSCCIIFMFRCV